MSVSRYELVKSAYNLKMSPEEAWLQICRGYGHMFITLQAVQKFIDQLEKTGCSSVSAAVQTESSPPESIEDDDDAKSVSAAVEKVSSQTEFIDDDSTTLSTEDCTMSDPSESPSFEYSSMIEPPSVHLLQSSLATAFQSSVKSFQSSSVKSLQSSSLTIPKQWEHIDGIRRETSYRVEQFQKWSEKKESIHDKWHYWRALILHCYLNCKSARETAVFVQSTYGQDSINIKTVYRWFDQFDENRYSLADFERPGGPKKVADSVIQDYVEKNQSESAAEIGLALELSSSSIYRRLHELGFVHKLERWIPHILTDKNRLLRLEICNELIQMVKSHPSILGNLITSDEKQVYLDNSSRIRVWRKRGAADTEPLPERARPDYLSKKVLGVFFWDCEGVFYTHLVPQGERLNGEKFRAILALADAQYRKLRPHKKRHQIWYLQDNAPAHRANDTVEYIKNKLHWHLLRHPANSPDLAPSDYYLFSHLEKELKNKGGLVFENSEKAMKFVRSYFDKQPAEFYKKGIDLLPERWNKCVNKDGCYFENDNK